MLNKRVAFLLASLAPEQEKVYNEPRDIDLMKTYKDHNEVLKTV